MMLKNTSPISRKTYVAELNTTAEEYDRYLVSNELIQIAFPKMSLEEREFIKMGFSFEESDLMFDMTKYTEIVLQDFRIRLKKLTWAMTKPHFQQLLTNLDLDKGFNEFIQKNYASSGSYNFHLAFDIDLKKDFHEIRQEIKNLLKIVEDTIKHLVNLIS